MSQITHNFKDNSIEKIEMVTLLPKQRAVHVHIKPNYDTVHFTESDLIALLAAIKLYPGEGNG